MASVDQGFAVQQFIDLCNGSSSNIRRNISHTTAVKFLYARKFDVLRAVSLYEQHELIRLREGLYNINPDIEPLYSELQIGKFTILPSRDTTGAAIAIFTASKHSPLSVTHTITLQGIVHQLDCALQDTRTQKGGLIFIYDMSGSKYSNFDYDLSQKILTLLKGGYPARLKKVLIVTAPLWFKAPFKILRLFVREKLRERVFTVSVPTLGLHVPLKALPLHLGGALEIDHATWLLQCRKSMTNREDELLANIEQVAFNRSSNNLSTTTNSIGNIVINSIVISGDNSKNINSNSSSNINNINTATTTITNGDCSRRLLGGEEPNENIAINDLCTVISSPISGLKRDSFNTTTSSSLPTINQIDSESVVVGTSLAVGVPALNGLDDSGAQGSVSLVNGCVVVPATATVTSSGSSNGSSGLSELWSENPPSSASSGFSDDDSLAGQEGDPKTIEQIVQMVKELGRRGLVKEYAEIRNRAPEGTFSHARMRNNLTKNRYTDVLCYDHSRVVLSREDGDDYINANFVDGYKQKNAYISTQGPLPKTSQDFWRMIWEQHCLVVVMTTRVMERGRVKCGQYWEPTENSSLEFGNFHVRTLSIEINEDYTVASLQLKNLKTDEIRNVSHWQFTSWPDYGVPSTAMAMLNFLQKVREKQAAMVKALGDTWAGHARGPPIVVHCSAGIGRTGTFITLDICISRLEDVGTADIRGTVEKIRSQRAYSIQMPDQYVFCHLALIEYAVSRGMLKSVDLTGFDDREEDSD
ncbi:tyrosine-protein phosphatase non-receptor type 9 isoform X2 [Eurosta solidaginis]|uniref:tyrosine-protein phosphatase non-receptor type 9 isoform X2 n=1 Tax=Eurosta solidaginis TaxID=178769 RepID=UPI0035313B89